MLFVSVCVLKFCSNLDATSLKVKIWFNVDLFYRLSRILVLRVCLGCVSRVCLLQANRPYLLSCRNCSTRQPGEQDSGVLIFRPGNRLNTINQAYLVGNHKKRVLSQLKIQRLEMWGWITNSMFNQKLINDES